MVLTRSAVKKLNRSKEKENESDDKLKKESKRISRLRQLRKKGSRKNLRSKMKRKAKPQVRKSTSNKKMIRSRNIVRKPQFDLDFNKIMQKSKSNSNRILTSKLGNISFSSFFDSVPPAIVHVRAPTPAIAPTIPVPAPTRPPPRPAPRPPITSSPGIISSIASTVGSFLGITSPPPVPTSLDVDGEPNEPATNEVLAKLKNCCDIYDFSAKYHDNIDIVKAIHNFFKKYKYIPTYKYSDDEIGLSNLEKVGKYVKKKKVGETYVETIEENEAEAPLLSLLSVEYRHEQLCMNIMNMLRLIDNNSSKSFDNIDTVLGTLYYEPVKNDILISSEKIRTAYESFMAKCEKNIDKYKDRNKVIFNIKELEPLPSLSQYDIVQDINVKIASSIKPIFESLLDRVRNEKIKRTSNNATKDDNYVYHSGLFTTISQVYNSFAKDGLTKYSILQNTYYNRKIKQCVDVVNQIEILNDYIINIRDLEENSSNERVDVNMSSFDEIKNKVIDIIDVNIALQPAVPNAANKELKHKAQLKCLNYALDDATVRELIGKLYVLYPFVEKIKEVLKEFRMIKIFKQDFPGSPFDVNLSILTTSIELYNTVKGSVYKIEKSQKLDKLIGISGASPYFEGLKLSLLIPLYKELNDTVIKFKLDFEAMYKMSETIKSIEKKKNAIISMLRTGKLKPDINIEIPETEKLRESFGNTVINYDNVFTIVKSLLEKHLKQYEMRIFTDKDAQNKKKVKYTQFVNDLEKNRLLIGLLEQILTERIPEPPITAPITPELQPEQSTIVTSTTAPSAIIGNTLTPFERPLPPSSRRAPSRRAPSRQRIQN